jgi:hypothetical protein
MRLFVLLAVGALAYSATVKQDRAQLRSGCYSDSDVIAVVEAGVPVTILYSLAGEDAPCYKVAIASGERTIEGYLSGHDIAGVEDFDKARRDAAWLDMTQVMGAVRSSGALRAAAGASRSGPNTVAARAADLIEESQPGKALAILEPELKSNKDPGLLMLAGIASWKNDDSRKALEYWRASLDKSPNPDLERLYGKVEKETRNDQSTERVVGLRVLLRYDSSVVKSDIARQMAGALDHEFSRVSDELGCRPEERVVAIAQSRDAYRKATESAEWSGGQYDGRIRVPVFDGQGLDATMKKTLAHEITHACLSIMGRWPAWLQEGLAQRLSGETLKPEVRQKLFVLAQQNKIPKLSNLGQDWSRMDADHAALAYALSLAAVDTFYSDYANYGIANLLRNPERLGPITADLERRLGF